MPLYQVKNPKLVLVGGTGWSTTGDTNENTLTSVTIPGGSLGPNGTLSIDTLWSYTNSANTKTMRIRFGSLAGNILLNITATTTATARFLSRSSNLNSQSSQIVFANGSIGNSGNPVSNLTVDTTVDSILYFRGLNGLSSETIKLESYLVEVFYGA
jgi:hypothetical protein